jgi:hypothetical protein
LVVLVTANEGSEQTAKEKVEKKKKKNPVLHNDERLGSEFLGGFQVLRFEDFDVEVELSGAHRSDVVRQRGSGGEEAH